MKILAGLIRAGFAGTLSRIALDVVLPADGSELALRHLFSAEGALNDPHLRIYRGEDVVALNDVWELATRAWFVPTGAFDLPNDSKDAAIRVPFSPGGYTVHATGNGGCGIAIIELYESPEP